MSRAAKENIHMGVTVQRHGEVYAAAWQCHCKVKNEQVSHWMDSPGLEKLPLNRSWDKSFPTKGLQSKSLEP